VAKERRHYPFMIYILTVLCALGLASIALAIADGWVLIAAGAVATTVSLGRLHVILQLRQAEVVRGRSRWNAPLWPRTVCSSQNRGTPTVTNADCPCVAVAATSAPLALQLAAEPE
jgi:hypothetical protein